MRLLELGVLVRSRISVRELALPIMRELHAQTAETVSFSVRHDDEIVYVERTSSGRSAMRIVHMIGDPCLPILDDSSLACTVTDELPDGQLVDVPACPAEGDCFVIVADPKVCGTTPTQLRATVLRATPPAPGTYVHVRC